MNLYFNGIEISKISVVPTTTIKKIKQVIYNWLHPQGIDNYTVRLIFNNNTELHPSVFNTNRYDKINFQVQANLIDGGSIFVNPLPEESTNRTGITIRTKIEFEFDCKFDVEPSIKKFWDFFIYEIGEEEHISDAIFRQYWKNVKPNKIEIGKITEAGIIEIFVKETLPSTKLTTTITPKKRTFVGEFDVENEYFMDSFPESICDKKTNSVHGSIYAIPVKVNN